MDFIKSTYRVYSLEFLAFILTLFSVGLSIFLQNDQIALIPPVILGAALMIQNLKSFFYLFALVLPFSIEMELPGGLATDLPTEPVMWGITGLGILFFIARAKSIDFRFWKHPISILLFLHIFWIGATSILSTDNLFSFKFFVAKLWYIIPFYFLFGLLNHNQGFTRKFFKILITSMTIAIVIILIRQAMEGFTFKTVNDCVHPIFRNHVNYAVMLVVLLPYIFWLRKGSKRKGGYNLLILLYAIAIYFSYTRAAMVAVLLGLIIYFIIHFKLIKGAILVAFLGISLSIPYLLHNNRFMDFAPNYERTIAHYDFDNLIKATYKLEDISTMERLYRWLAGIEMVKEKPIFGFGPSTFYSNYQHYTVTAFATYVSNNPEKSGIHNYYLMVMVEQGIIGVIIWLLLLVVVFVVGQKTHAFRKDKNGDLLNMAALCSVGMAAAILAINDLMEVDKIGPLVYIGMAVIASAASFEQWNKNNADLSAP